MNKWFGVNLSTEEVKKLYRDLAKRYHPDMNRGEDTTKIMQEINKEYFTALKSSMSRDGVSSDTIHEELEMEARYVEKINCIGYDPLIIVELVGKWIWVTGNTYAVKDHIKKCGFIWANKKKAWYWRPEELKSANRKRMSLEEIKAAYGAKIVSTYKNRALNDEALSDKKKKKPAPRKRSGGSDNIA